jgi:glycosyltransferase involved in cell wall biosynthesis
MQNSERSSPGPGVEASVVIATQDRKDALRQVINSLMHQTLRPEIVVLDDCSRDGTPEMVRSEFPDVQLVTTDAPLGYVAHRTEGGRRAHGRIIFFLDDDMVLESNETLEHTLGEFDHPRVGALAIPFMEAWDREVRFRAPAPTPPFATFRFAGGSSAVRRDVFLAVGGFRPELFLLGEESDYCLRMLAAGFVTRLGTAPPMLHLRLPPDDLRAKAFYGRRNDVLYAWRNVPMPYLPMRLVKVAAQSAVVGATFREPVAAARGTARGVWQAARDPGQRDPVSRDVYRLAHRLKKRHAIPIHETEHELPSPRPTAPVEA